jgi:hypothetical protein
LSKKDYQPYVADFARIFAGLERVHGRYIVPSDAKPNGAGKVEGKAWTAHKPITEEDWLSHLSGQRVTVRDGDEKLTGSLGLGVVPIRDDATCVFGAGDVDVYPLDLPDIARKIAVLGLPVILVRSKSGGAHVYLFLSEPVPAELVRSKLMEWMILLGYPGVEVFPKQIRLASERDEGNWINVPYAGGDRSTRYALRQGEALLVGEFVEHARKMMISRASLESFAASFPEMAEADDFLRDGPPCLQVLARAGFPQGTRSNGLFNLGVYLKKRYGPTDYEPYLMEANQKFMQPPLGERDVESTIKSLRKKNYSYKCKDQPICEVCNRATCLTREYGVSGAGDDPGVTFGELVKIETDPPTWIWDVNGKRLELRTEDLMNQRAFQARAMEVLNEWPSEVKPNTWRMIIQDRLERVKVVVIPDDATREGQLWVHLGRFCTSRLVGKHLDDLLRNLPFTDEAAARTYFCSADFLQYLQQHRVSGIAERDLYRWLRKRGVEHHTSKIKGKQLSYWSVPAFERQTEDHSVPRVQREGEM